jgi:hypothetical protein
LLRDGAAAHSPRLLPLADLQAVINAYLAEHNASPKPLVWTQAAQPVTVKLDRYPVLPV